MREIDEVRITLLRLFRKGAPGTAVAHHTPTHSLYGENEGLWPPNTIDFQLWPMVPQVIIKLINGILRGRPVDSHQERVHASIKLQAYGRGLLQRFRSHRLITKDFNRQASREYQKYLKLFGVISTGITSSHTREPSRFARTFALYHHKRITEDYQGIRAKWYTREHRESRKALAYHLPKDACKKRPCLSAYLQECRWASHGYPNEDIHGAFGWLQPRFTRFVKRRLNWRAHRSRLGVKLLGFSSN